MAQGEKGMTKKFEIDTNTTFATITPEHRDEGFVTGKPNFLVFKVEAELGEEVVWGGDTQIVLQIETRNENLVKWLKERFIEEDHCGVCLTANILLSDEPPASSRSRVTVTEVLKVSSDN